MKDHHRQEMKQRMKEQWLKNKAIKLKQMREEYENHIHHQIGQAQKNAQISREQLFKQTKHEQKIIQHQKKIAKIRGKKALSKIQQKILNEKRYQNVRCEWREKALQMSVVYRQKLNKQLQWQNIHLPIGLQPSNVINHIGSGHPYNLQKYVPSKILSKLNRKYHKHAKRKKKKKKEKYEQNGVQLASNYNDLRSIPENQILHNSYHNCIHQKNGHIQQSLNVHLCQIPIPAAVPIPIPLENDDNVYNAAIVEREARNIFEKTRVQQFLKAQERGKIAMRKMEQIQKAKKLETELALLHKRILKERQIKCQQITIKDNDIKEIENECKVQANIPRVSNVKPILSISNIESYSIPSANIIKKRNGNINKSKNIDGKMRVRRLKITPKRIKNENTSALSIPTCAPSSSSSISNSETSENNDNDKQMLCVPRSWFESLLKTAKEQNVDTSVDDIIDNQSSYFYISFILINKHIF